MISRARVHARARKGVCIRSLHGVYSGSAHRARIGSRSWHCFFAVRDRTTQEDLRLRSQRPSVKGLITLRSHHSPSLSHFLQNLAVGICLGLLSQAITFLRKLAILFFHVKLTRTDDKPVGLSQRSRWSHNLLRPRS
jgi:hypothetical protein